MKREFQSRWIKGSIYKKPLFPTFHRIKHSFTDVDELEYRMVFYRWHLKYSIIGKRALSKWI